MSEYFLMNKNSKLLLFRVSLDKLSQYYCQEIERYVDDNLLPQGFVSIHDWVETRNYAKHKEHLQKWLKDWQIDNVKGFIDLTHALGLNDTLWVCPAETDISWQDVSLYTNKFTDVAAKTAFNKGLQGLKLSSTSPEFTSEGSFEKCWIREREGNIKLYKKGSSGFANAGLEPYSEFYASQLASIICKSSVAYTLHYFKRHLVSECNMFTDEDNGFVPVYKYLDMSKRYRMEEILTFMEKLGFAEEFMDMIVLDSVILNPDRHLGNFGFLVDNDTFQIKRFAPVFDNNMSLLARGMEDTLESDVRYVRNLGHKIGGDFVLTAKKMLTSRTRSILHQLQDFTFTRHKSYNLPSRRLRCLDNIVCDQVRNILVN